MPIKARIAQSDALPGNTQNSTIGALSDRIPKNLLKITRVAALVSFNGYR
jgi:hypothetical protein